MILHPCVWQSDIVCNVSLWHCHWIESRDRLISIFVYSHYSLFCCLMELIEIHNSTRNHHNPFPLNWNSEICSNWNCSTFLKFKRNHTTTYWMLMWVWSLSECSVAVLVKRVFEIFLKYCLINLEWDWGCAIKTRWEGEGILRWRKFDFHKTIGSYQWNLFLLSWPML